jgi:hypothetical protein
VEPLSIKGYTINGISQVSSTLYNRVRLGDIDIDGYPDLFITLELSDGTTSSSGTSSNLISTTVIMMNSECNTVYCTQSLIDAGRRYFDQDTSSSAYAYSATSIVGSQGTVAAYIDADNNGNIDVLLQYNEGGYKVGTNRIALAYNNIQS